MHQGWKWAFKKLCCCVGGRVELCQFRPVSFSPRVTSTRVNFKFDPLPYILLEELLSNTRLNFLYFLVELLVQFLLSGTSPVLILFTTVQLISFDISPHCSTWLYSLIERCCAPAYKGDTKDDTSKLSIFLHRDRSVSASESH